MGIRHTTGYIVVPQSLELDWRDGTSYCVYKQDIFKRCIFPLSTRIKDAGIAIRHSQEYPSPVFVTAHPFLQYLAPLGAKYMEKRLKKYKKCGF